MAKGGSRFGAGRPAYKVKAEQLKRIDVREFARRGMLARVGRFTWSWNRGGESSGNIGVTVDPRRAVSLDYTIPNDGQTRFINERVSLIFKPCNFGGARPWFGCPRCERQVAVLYLRAGRFACRHCQRVAYSSQSDSVMASTWRKQRHIETKIGENWQRPKRMRHRTFDRLMDELADCVQRREEALCIFTERFLDALGDRSRWGV